MTAEDAQEFLEDHCWGRLGTVSAEGEPHVAPIGYVCVAGRLYLHALRRSRRTRDLAHESRVALCVDDGVAEGETYSQRRGVVVYATSRAVGSDDGRLPEVRERFAETFFGDPSTDFERSTHDWYELTPYRIASWDFGRNPKDADRFSRTVVDN